MLFVLSFAAGFAARHYGGKAAAWCCEIADAFNRDPY